jgi:hypothetical protein
MVVAFRLGSLSPGATTPERQAMARIHAVVENRHSVGTATRRRQVRLGSGPSQGSSDPRSRCKARSRWPVGCEPEQTVAELVRAERTRTRGKLVLKSRIVIAIDRMEPSACDLR